MSDMYVIKHREMDKFIALTKRGPVWEDTEEQAQKYASEHEAISDIRYYGIPYCKARKARS